VYVHSNGYILDPGTEPYFGGQALKKTTARRESNDREERNF